MGVIKRPKFKHVSPLTDNGVELLPGNEPLQTQEAGDPILNGSDGSDDGQAADQHANTSIKLVPASFRKSANKTEKFPKGQKKRRRYENNKYLLNLAVPEDGKRSDPGFTESRSAFATLLQETDKMAAWKAFLTFSEDDQLAIIANNEVLAFFNNEAVLDQAPSAVVQKVASYREYRRSMTPDEAFRSLCPKLRSIFSKRHFPMGILNQIENQVLDFFLDNPTGVCVIERSCSFDRLILHAVSQFNILFSQSFAGQGGRETHVRNICSDFIPPIVSLSEYVGKKRHG